MPRRWAWRSQRCPTGRGSSTAARRPRAASRRGARFAEICMAGLGTVAYAPLVLDGRWLPGLTVTTDRPAVACLASQYAGWRLDREGYFAMGSGPGRALIRAEDLYDDLGWDEHANAAVLCLETREAPPAEVADFVARARRRGRLGADPADGADGERGRRRADRGAGRRDGAAQAPRARLRRAASRRRLRQLPAAAGGGRRHGGARAHQRRRALRRPGPPHRRGRRRRRAARPGRSGCPPRPRRTTASRSARS